MYKGIARALSCVTITVDDNPAVSLGTIPDEATSAEITVEVDANSTNTSKAIRYRTDGGTPVTGASGTNAGIPVGDFDTFEIVGRPNLLAFKAIACDVVGNKYLKVQFYK